jgi:hypothetical protein
MGLGQGWDTDIDMDAYRATDKDTDMILQGRSQGPGADKDVAPPPPGG